MSTTGTFVPTEPHPVLQLPTPAEAARMGAEAFLKAMELRERAIAEELAEPMFKCWEPPIWKVCDALWGAPWLEEAEAEAIRRNLKFPNPVNVLLLNGGWASSKTEYAANRISRLMQRKPNGISWFLHETRPSQQDQQDPIIYKYLPPNLKTEKNIMGKGTYIAYKRKTGFSEGSFVLPNNHVGRFWTYEGGVDKLQGPTVSDAWADELLPPDFIPAVRSRVSRSGGVFFITFAPIHGYSPTMQEFWAGAEVVKESIAYLNPKDGGPRDVARYLGLSEEEFVQLRAWMDRPQVARMKGPFPNVPWSRPEDCAKWLTDPSTGSGQVLPAPGRIFKSTPRVIKPKDVEERSAVVCFHGPDNPFGSPFSVYALNANVSEEMGNRYFYGVAAGGMARMFPRFGKEHIIPDDAVPKFGTNYLWVDPAGRNFFMLWVRFGPQKRIYVYREWPGNYDIPGQGVPGPWALPDGKLKDGKRGPAQESFGYGLVDYKRELARLEGWKDALKAYDERKSDTEQVKEWFAENGADEVVADRFMDSRYASTPHIEQDRPVTLLENFADVGLFFRPTPGDSVNEGVKMITDALRWDTTKPMNGLNCPRLYIAESCQNTIFALRTWCNADGSKSATGDPIACLRYAMLQGVGYFAPEDYAASGGGHY